MTELHTANGASLTRLLCCYRRWIFCCCTCCCGLCRPSIDPLEYISGTSMTVTKVTAVVMAVGVVISGIYGMTKAGPHLVDQTVGTVDTLKVTLKHRIIT